MIEFQNRIDDLNEKKTEALGKLKILEKASISIKLRKEADPASFSDENESYLGKLGVGIKKLEKRIDQYDKEMEKIKEFIREVERGTISEIEIQQELDKLREREEFILQKQALTQAHNKLAQTRYKPLETLTSDKEFKSTLSDDDIDRLLGKNNTPFGDNG